ncbi:MAG: SIR2 family protein [Chitinophagaceae bacterium]
MKTFQGKINDRLLDFAKQGELVIMAGAGVSCGAPSSLPGWYSLNASIAKALCRRLDEYLEENNWLTQFIPIIEKHRDRGSFPPDYQAQVVEEICGENYFRGLQSLDVDVINSSHEAIAQLAASGSVRCIVTTNFDSLIERALEKYRVRYIVAYNEPGYARLAERLVSDETERMVPVLKIHGSVTDHLSMIDTLKQRKQGRSRQLQICLDRLHTSYWIYLGFSAEDLETDPGYLGLLNGATYGSGATYLAYPLHPVLKRGAQMLMEAYEDRGEIISAFGDEYLSSISSSGNPLQSVPAIRNKVIGLEQFEKNLERWVNSLSPASAALCVTAILEATGEAESAARILDQLVRKELFEYRETREFKMLQLHYGRLGASWGRFFGVPDLNGMSSNASVETVQSLLRLDGTEFEFAARSWLCILYLWLNKGEMATRSSIQILNNIHSNNWTDVKPSDPEELADAWIAAAQVSVLNAGPEIIRFTISTADIACNAVTVNGNVIRAARIISLKGLCLAQAGVDVDHFFSQHEAVFADAERAGDSFSLGFRSLALGRWAVGSAGLERARITGGGTIARIAQGHLQQARNHLSKSGLEAWLIYISIQEAKAFADLSLLSDAQICIDYALQTAERFPVMSSFIQEAIGQILQMQDNPDAIYSFENALDDARESGLNFRTLFLENIIENQFGERRSN